jgi:hypothetical protein
VTRQRHRLFRRSKKIDPNSRRKVPRLALAKKRLAGMRKERSFLDGVASEVKEPARVCRALLGAAMT